MIELLTHESLAGMTLDELMETSYALAVEAGRNEVAMWMILAHIRETDMWKEQNDSWEEFAREWLGEVCNRAGSQMPFSIREIQTRLASYSRLCGVGAAPELVLAASSDTMSKLTRAIGNWDRKGNLVAMSDSASLGLNKMFPGMDASEQIKAVAETVAAIPIHKDAIDFINDNLVGPQSETTYRFQIFVSASGVPVLQVEVARWNLANGECVEIRYFRTDNQEAWPDGAVFEMERRLR